MQRPEVPARLTKSAEVLAQEPNANRKAARRNKKRAGAVAAPALVIDR